MISHPFQEGMGGRDESPKEGWGGRDESPFPKRGGTVMSHTKRACLKGRGGLHQSQPVGGGGGHIMLMCKQNAYYSTTEATRINFAFQ